MGALEKVGLGFALFFEEDFSFDGAHPSLGAEFVGDVGEVSGVDPITAVPAVAFGVESGPAATELRDDVFNFGGVAFAFNLADRFSPFGATGAEGVEEASGAAGVTVGAELVDGWGVGDGRGEPGISGGEGEDGEEKEEDFRDHRSGRFGRFHRG